MKNREHGLSEKEMELVKLLVSECETTGDIQNLSSQDTAHGFSTIFCRCLR